MGLGDAYVGAAIGLLLGVTRGMVAGVLGVWIGALVGVCALLLLQVFPHVRLSLAGTRVTLRAELPFAPFLAVGALLAFFIPLPLLTLGLLGS